MRRRRALARAIVSIWNNGLAIDHKLLHPVLERGPDNPWIALGPVMAVGGDQFHTIAVALHDQTIPAVLEFVDPIRPGWNLDGAGGNAGLERKLRMQQR
jgi:hypothetical protein